MVLRVSTYRSVFVRGNENDVPRENRSQLSACVKSDRDVSLELILEHFSFHNRCVIS